jgi:hypothetical protein
LREQKLRLVGLGEVTMANDTIVRPRAFVIMPFGEGFNEIYNLFISGALIEAGYDVLRADDIRSQQNILKDIVVSIVNSNLIVADLTGANPNVYYEVGLAHAFRKQVILMTQEIDDLPFDLRSYRVISYSTHFSDINRAKTQLVSLATDARTGKIPFGSPVTDFLSGLPAKAIIQEEEKTEKMQQTIVGEAGLLDYIVDMEDGFTKLSETVLKVAAEMESISKTTTAETERLNALSGSGGPARTKRAVVINIAQFYSRFADSLSRYNDDYADSLTTTRTSLEYLIRAQRPSNDEERHQLRAFVEQMNIFETSVQEAKASIDSLAEITRKMPRVERTFNIAADSIVHQLDKYSQNLDQTISMIVRARQLAQAKLGE